MSILEKYVNNIFLLKGLNCIKGRILTVIRKIDTFTNPRLLKDIGNIL